MNFFNFKNIKKKKAFTLVEILIVVAVIGILFVALVPRIDFAGDKARETEVKNDFRSFEIAAEQYIREKGGLSECDAVLSLCEDDALNMFLDGGLKFNSAGNCAKEDPWNGTYTVQIMKPTGTGVNPNNGAVIFICNGKDGKLDATDDNYAVAVTFCDGEIDSATTGFSSNIESGVTIGAGSDTKYEITSSGIALNYKT